MNATRLNSQDGTVSQSLQRTIYALDEGDGVTIGQLLTHLASEAEDGADINGTLERLERLEDAGEIYNAAGMDADDPRYRVTDPDDLDLETDGAAASIELTLDDDRPVGDLTDLVEDEDDETPSIEVADDALDVAPGTEQTIMSRFMHLGTKVGWPVTASKVAETLPWDTETVHEVIESSPGVHLERSATVARGGELEPAYYYAVGDGGEQA